MEFVYTEKQTDGVVDRIIVALEKLRFHSRLG